MKRLRRLLLCLVVLAVPSAGLGCLSTRVPWSLTHPRVSHLPPSVSRRGG